MKREHYRAAAWFAAGLGVGAYAAREIAESRAATITNENPERAAELDSLILDESEKATMGLLVLGATVATVAYFLSPGAKG